MRIVYNGTPIRLNAYLWDPYFTLPIVASNLRKVERGHTWQIEI